MSRLGTPSKMEYSIGRLLASGAFAKMVENLSSNCLPNHPFRSMSPEDFPVLESTPPIRTHPEMDVTTDMEFEDREMRYQVTRSLLKGRGVAPEVRQTIIDHQHDVEETILKKLIPDILRGDTVSDDPNEVELPINEESVAEEPPLEVIDINGLDSEPLGDLPPLEVAKWVRPRTKPPISRQKLNKKQRNRKQAKVSRRKNRG